MARSSFHESATPALGLAHYAEITGHVEACRSAERTAELLLRRRLFRSTSTGQPVHVSWTVPHYPAYWHYDVVQGLRLLATLGRLGDPRATDALDLVERSRRRNGRFSGRRWSSKRQPPAVDWGSGTDNLMLNEIATAVLAAANSTASNQHRRPTAPLP